MLKKLLAVSFRDPRPSFLDDDLSDASCHCVFGNPSGHMSYTVNSYLFLYYYFIYQGDFSTGSTVVIFGFLIIFMFTLGVS